MNKDLIDATAKLQAVSLKKCACNAIEMLRAVRNAIISSELCQ